MSERTDRDFLSDIQEAIHRISGTGSKTYETHIKDFIPKKNLRVYFIKKGRGGN